MMHDSRPWAEPARELARSHMALVTNLHLVHLAIVSGKDEVHFLQFEDADCDRMLAKTIPAFVRDSAAVSVIISSPAVKDVRDGVYVTLMERTLESFYVPIVRVRNAEPLIGDFRPTNAVDGNRYGAVFEALIVNWVERDRA